MSRLWFTSGKYFRLHWRLCLSQNDCNERFWYFDFIPHTCINKFKYFSYVQFFCLKCFSNGKLMNSELFYKLKLIQCALIGVFEAINWYKNEKRTNKNKRMKDNIFMDRHAVDTFIIMCRMHYEKLQVNTEHTE